MEKDDDDGLLNETRQYKKIGGLEGQEADLVDQDNDGKFIPPLLLLIYIDISTYGFTIWTMDYVARLKDASPYKHA